jgi:hypothetical protein
MSHIDSFKHEIVGLFGGLPVYHPLENIDGEFSCTTSQLLLGGGSGEHPALVIRNPLAAVAHFLDDELRSLEGNNVSVKRYPLKRHADAWKEIIKDHLTWDHRAHLEFNGWNIETYARFHELCRSPALPNPCSDDKRIEDWLILGFGEFVFFAMPELAKEIVGRLDNPYTYFAHMRYNNILLIPRNVPVYANGGNAFSFGRTNA